MRKLEKVSVMLRFPKTLLNRIDAYQKEKGFSTRTQTIFHLLNVALEKSNS
ncbi:ribbon-helix-helix domain-containing protein [Caryophanon latum]|uniref:ribbon-helix-helix domain-containing protein n=1 Tax=Caryophanon latum TaxID=33977 RepID=UPI001FE097F3|nr:ribbon-helix-helix domain-containing protein [Caryophanon latum]